jgi:hypothetical protein
MILHHYTSMNHVPLILKEACIETTESNVDMVHQHWGPDVVWLVDPSLPPADVPSEYPHGLSSVKSRIRFTVDVPDSFAIKWTSWEYFHEMNEHWRRVFVEAGGGELAADHWYVCPSPIFSHRWMSITDLHTGQEVTF